MSTRIIVVVRRYVCNRVLGIRENGSKRAHAHGEQSFPVHEGPDMQDQAAIHAWKSPANGMCPEPSALTNQGLGAIPKKKSEKGQKQIDRSGVGRLEFARRHESGRRERQTVDRGKFFGT